MKPIRLCIDGINSFLDKQTLDFTALSSDLFCIYGDTGAGKSTILDSIILALFGECNRGDNIRGVDYINLERESAEIEFEFLMEGVCYRVWRQFTRGKAGSEPKKKAQFFVSDTLVSTQLSEIGRLVSDALGLSMSDFTQVVVLEQGQFNRFLFSTRKERSLTVSKLFHLDRFKDLFVKTDRRLAVVFERLTAINSAIATYADYSAEGLEMQQNALKTAILTAEGLDSQVAVASERCQRLAADRLAFESNIKAALRKTELGKEMNQDSEALENLVKQVGEGMTEYETAKKQRDEVSLQLDRLKNLLPRLEERKECEQKLILARQKYAATKKTYDDLTAQISVLESNKKQIETQQNALKTAIGQDFEPCDIPALAINAQNLLRDFDKLSAEITAAKADYDKAVQEEKSHRQVLLRFNSDLDSTRQNLEALTEKTKTAEQEYQQELKNGAAASVAAMLKSGENCPVCGGVFALYSGKTGQAEQKKQAFDTLTTQTKLAEKTAAELDSLVKLRLQSIMTAEAQKSATGDRIKQLENQQRQLKTSSREDCLKLIELSQNALKLHETAEKTKTELDKSLATLVALSQTLEEQKEGGAELKNRLETLTNEIKQKGGDNPEEQQARLQAEQARLEQGIAAYEKTQAEIATQISALKSGLAAKQKEFSLIEVKKISFSQEEFTQAETNYKNLLKQKNQLSEQVGVLKQKIDESAAAIKKCAQLEKEKKQQQKQLDKLDTLKKLFKGEKFLEFIADEYIASFTADASAVLSDISGGKYTMQYEAGEGKFYVTDFLFGGKKRKVSTLSGGEIFLASLSLATAIARHISQKSYDFFFLDEGFGTLDTKTMDTVADALAQLSKCSMVGIISHRSELVERMPARIKVVAAAGDDGSKIIIE